MSTRAQQHTATVVAREQQGEHLVRLTLAGDGLADFVSTGVPDEWIGLVVPGQFQSRYYTVRSWREGRLVLDVVVHESGLVTEWAARDCVGDVVTVSDPKGSFAMPDDATWLVLVGDLTALPAMARILEGAVPPRTRVVVESPDHLPGYLPTGVEAEWAPGDGSDLAARVEQMTLPEGPGYFWMAGESAQMRAIRKHLMREVRLPAASYDVMGYWRATPGRQPRRVDPGPIWRAGKASGRTDEQIWADYDAAREAAGE